MAGIVVVQFRDCGGWGKGLRLGGEQGGAGPRPALASQAASALSSRVLGSFERTSAGVGTAFPQAQSQGLVGINALAACEAAAGRGPVPPVVQWGRMKITIRIKPDECISAANCTGVAPKFFKIGDEPYVELLDRSGAVAGTVCTLEVNAEELEALHEAAEACPTRAIEVVEQA